MAHPTSNGRTLGDLGMGESGAVGGYLEAAAARRFMALGLVPGAVVTAMRAAPLGDPIEYAVKGSRVSMRRSDAASITLDD